MDTLSKKRKSDAAATTAAAVSPPTAAVLRAVLDPLTKDQLIDIISSTAHTSPSLLSAVRSASASDPARRKLFVRGLGPDTSSEALSAAFSPFGELEEAVAVADRVTGRLRGFGFVVFRYVDGALMALERPSKRIDGRMTVAQIAADGNGAADVAARKVYVGNIPSEVSADRLLSQFMVYGEVEEGPLGFDNQSGKPRRFAFFIYKTEEGARACLADPMKTIDGTQVICKLAVDGKKGGKPFGQNEGDFGNVSNMFPPGPGFVNPGPVGYQKPFGNQAVPPRGGGPGYPPVPFYDHGFAVGGPRFHGPGSNEFGGNAGPMFGVPPGGYPEGGNYGPGFSEGGNFGPGYPSQMNQPPSGPRGPHPGGMYPGVAPPFF